MDTTAENKDAILARLKQKLNQSSQTKVNKPAQVSALSLDSIPSEYYDLTNFPEKPIMQAHQALLEKLNVDNNYFSQSQASSKNVIQLEDGEYINFSGYNYLGFSGHPEVNRYVYESIEKYGTSASASRIVAGNLKIHDELEQAYADALGTENCVIGVGGYIINVSTISYLVGKDDLVIHDEYSHNSLIMGCALSGAHRLSFPHNDMAALEKLLATHRLKYKRTLIITEGVFSMDGDIADIPSLIKLKEKYKSLLMVDEAHSIGTIGSRGLGVIDHFNIDPKKIDIVMGTMSKAFASCGGFIAGSDALIEQLKYFAPGLIMYSAGLSPQNTAAAFAALKLMLKEPERVEKIQANSAYFLGLLKEAGVNTGPSKNSPVVPVITGDDEKALRLVQALREGGVNVHAMLYPSVPREQVRLRFFISSTHSFDELEHTANIIIKHLAYVGGKQ